MSICHVCDNEIMMLLTSAFYPHLTELRFLHSDLCPRWHWFSSQRPCSFGQGNFLLPILCKTNTAGGTGDTNWLYTKTTSKHEVALM
jgi:hypothetical protein